MAVDIIARGMASNGGSGGVDQSYVDTQDRKTLNDAKSYTDETAVEYIGREQQIDFNATLEGNIIIATLDETVSDFTFTSNTGYLFHIYLPLVTLTGDLDNSYEIILKDKDSNTININCMFQKDITKTSTVGDLCQIQDYDTGIGYSWEFYGNYREITENGTLIREVYTDTVVRETNPSMTGQDLHLAIVNSKLKVGTAVMCTTNYENNGSTYYAGRTYKINGDYSTGELILSAEDITVKDTGWVELTLVNDATNIVDDRKLSYRKVGDVVYLSGAIIPPASAVDAAVTIAYLPEGFRPHYPYESFIVRNSDGYCIAGINFDSIDGAIWIQNAANGETSFSNVSFIADN